MEHKLQVEILKEMDLDTAIDRMDARYVARRISKMNTNSTATDMKFRLTAMLCEVSFEDLLGIFETLWPTDKVVVRKAEPKPRAR